MDNSTDQLSRLTPLERTRLLLGIVMIPLAATCIFAAGSYSQRIQHDQNPTLQLRLIYSERERRQEQQARWDSEDPAANDEVDHHSAVPPAQALAVLAQEAYSRESSSQQSRQPNVYPHLAYTNQLPVRGPPIHG